MAASERSDAPPIQSQNFMFKKETVWEESKPDKKKGGGRVVFSLILYLFSFLISKSHQDYPSNQKKNFSSSHLFWTFWKYLTSS